MAEDMQQREFELEQRLLGSILRNCYGISEHPRYSPMPPLWNARGIALCNRYEMPGTDACFAVFQATSRRGMASEEKEKKRSRSLWLRGGGVCGQASFLSARYHHTAIGRYHHTPPLRTFRY